jgi:hypothetical protein
MLTLRPLRVLVTLVAVVGFAPAVLAGPPLICHPFVTDAAAPMLPWVQSKNWHSPAPGYDRSGLVADTLELLSADAPILARMENMRRATIYADDNPSAAAELLRAVVARTETQPGDALAWFDAGYLVETYRQLGLIYQHEMRPSHSRWTSLVPGELASLDGYALVQKAFGLAPESRAELDFASALMTREPLTATHLRRAAASVTAGSLLAQNLVHYDVR